MACAYGSAPETGFLTATNSIPLPGCGDSTPRIGLLVSPAGRYLRRQPTVYQRPESSSANKREQRRIMIYGSLPSRQGYGIRRLV